MNKAVYTATEIACGWAGAVMPKMRENTEKAKGLRGRESTELENLVKPDENRGNAFGRMFE